MPMVLPNDLENIFTYHAAKDEDRGKYESIRAGALAFAKIVVAATPQCADQSAAIRLVREAVMTANAAIALEGKI